MPSSRASSTLADLFGVAGQSLQAAEQVEQHVQPEHVQWPAARHTWPHTLYSLVIS